LSDNKGSRFYIYIILALMLVYMVYVGIFLYQRELRDNPGLSGDILDTNNVVEFYSALEPSTDNIPFYGDSGASVTLIAYFDIISDETGNFFNEFFPLIKEEFINKGKLRYYQKHYITEEDYQKKTDRYIYVKAMLCVAKIDKDKYYDIYFDILETKKEVMYYAEKYNISGMAECVLNEELEEIQLNIAEVRKLGMLGIKQRIYLGLDGADNQIIDGMPSYENFQRSVKKYLFEVGDPV